MKEINGYTMLTVPEGSTDFSISYEYKQNGRLLA